jgi:Putative porin
MAMIRKIPVLMLLCFFCASLHAQDADEARRELETLRQTTVKMIETMVQSGIITKEKAEELLREARREAAKATLPGQTAEDKEKVIRVPYVPQMVRDSIKEEIRDEVLAQAKKERWGEPGALPEWLSRITFSGDVRFRYQYNQMAASNGLYLNVQDTNVGSGPVLLNTTENDDLWRIRARLGVEAKLSEWATAGLRLSTGSNTNPVSDNQTLGNTGNRSNFALDRAFIRLDAASWITIQAGRFANPFVSTDLIWDEDLSFEGLSSTLRSPFRTAPELFVTLGAFPLENFDCTNTVQIPDCKKDKWIYGAQVGLDRRLGGDHRVKFSASLYDFKDIAGSLNDAVIDVSNRSSIPKFMQRGNSVFNVVTSGANPLLGLAADYRLLNLTGSFDYAGFDPVHVKILADFVKNIGYDADKIRARTGGAPPIVTGLAGSEFTPRTKGYQARLAIGHEKIDKWGDWQVVGGYKYLERDAVVDGFTDSDFHLGGTDAKGWILGASYGVAANTWLRARWLSANEIDGPPLSIDVLQIDLNAKF